MNVTMHLVVKSQKAQELKQYCLPHTDPQIVGCSSSVKKVKIKTKKENELNNSSANVEPKHVLPIWQSGVYQHPGLRMRSRLIVEKPAIKFSCRCFVFAFVFALLVCHLSPQE